jgi:hypothetical protein
MKYFTYNLVFSEEANGWISPYALLPQDSVLGVSDGEKYYAAANIDNFDAISDYNPVEVSKELFDRYANPAPDITTRQFYMQAMKEGLLIQQDVENAIKNRIIPVSIQSVLDAAITDHAQKFNAEMSIISAIYFERSNSLVELIGTSFGKTTYEIDQFFRNASKL